MFTDDTPISRLTVGELREVIRQELSGLTDFRTQPARGIRGIADLFGVSYTQAKRIKASGIIDGAVSQTGRTIVVDRERALELYHRATHGRPSYKH